MMDAIESDWLEIIQDLDATAVADAERRAQIVFMLVFPIVVFNPVLRWGSRIGTRNDRQQEKVK